MLGNNSSRRGSSRSARLSPSISHTVATRRQRPAAKVHLTNRPSITRKKTTTTSTKKPTRISLSRAKSQLTNRLRLEPKRLTTSEYSLLGILATACLCIITAFLTIANFDPARDAERAMSNLAADYYIEFLYPRTLGSQINNPAPILSRYAEIGFPSVRLSHILLYNNGSHASYASYFNNKHYQCDTSHSYFRFYPVAPYGPRDYTVEYSPDCLEVI